MAPVGVPIVLRVIGGLVLLGLVLVCGGLVVGCLLGGVGVDVVCATLLERVGGITIELSDGDVHEL